MPTPSERAETALTSQSFEEMCEPFCDGTQPPAPRSGPRYYVTSITGFNEGRSRRPSVVYQVLDQHYGHALIVESKHLPAVTRVARLMNAGLFEQAHKWIREREHKAAWQRAYKLRFK